MGFFKAGKKAEMGVGTLIVFIAFILVAAIAAGVLIQTAVSLQQRALAVGDEAERNVATHIEIIEVTATDGLHGNLDNFTMTIRLSAGSDPIKFSDSFITVNTPNRTANLKYRGIEAPNRLGNTGFNTFNDEEIGVLGNNSNNYTLFEDLDDDGVDDYLYLGPSSVFFVLSDAGTINVTLDSGTFLSGATPSVSRAAVASGTTTYAYLTVVHVTGGITGDATIAANESFYVEPFEEGQGYFTVEYINQGTNFVEGYLQSGDTTKLYYESPGHIGENVKTRISFIPKVGTTSVAKFSTPDVITKSRLYLFP